MFIKVRSDKGLAFLFFGGSMDINLYDYRINIKTAGPSLQGNLRSELYFAGCRKAEEGDPLIMSYGNENKVLMCLFNLS